MVAFSDEISTEVTTGKPIKCEYLNSWRTLYVSVVNSDHIENTDGISKYIKNCLMDVVLMKNNLFLINYYGKTLKFKVNEPSDLTDFSDGDLLCNNMSKL